MYPINSSSSESTFLSSKSWENWSRKISRIFLNLQRFEKKITVFLHSTFFILDWEKLHIISIYQLPITVFLPYYHFLSFLFFKFYTSVLEKNFNDLRSQKCFRLSRRFCTTSTSSVHFWSIREKTFSCWLWESRNLLIFKVFYPLSKPLSIYHHSAPIDTRTFCPDRYQTILPRSIPDYECKVEMIFKDSEKFFLLINKFYSSLLLCITSRKNSSYLMPHKIVNSRFIKGLVNFMFN